MDNGREPEEDVRVPDGETGPGKRLKTDEELKELAIAVVEGRVFTSLQVDMTNPDALRMIFMPLALMDKAQTKAFNESEPAMLYEDMSKASPRAINGYPCFFSFKQLGLEDTHVFMQKYTAIRKAMESV